MEKWSYGLLKLMNLYCDSNTPSIQYAMKSVSA